jgi:hypothetical protein
MGDELGAIVTADERRCRLEAGQLLKHCHYVFGLAVLSYPDGQAEAAVLVDHVQELEAVHISSGIELEVRGPHLVGVLSLVAPH